MGAFDDLVPKKPGGGAFDDLVNKPQLNSSVQGFINALQGPTFGFLDELAGLGGAAVGAVANLTPYGDGKSLSENYTGTRDQVRAATNQFRQDYPVTATTTNMMASAPMIFGAPQTLPAGMVPRVAGMVPRTAQGILSGGLYSGVQGAGESNADSVGGVLADAGKDAAIGLAAGGALTLGGNAVGAVGSNIAQRFAPAAATQAAREKVAESIVRDARGVGENNPLLQANARLNTLQGRVGNEATVADSAGQSANSLLDLVATLPGRTKDAAERLIRGRQAGRGERLMNAADEALGTNGVGYKSVLDGLQGLKNAAYTPLYNKASMMPISRTPELSDIVSRPVVQQAIEQANINRLNKNLPAIIDEAGNLKGNLPFSVWDDIKRGLDDVAGKIKRGTVDTSKEKSTLSAAVDSKQALVSEIDRQTGGLYRKMLNSFSGPSAMQDAIESGRQAMKQDIFDVAETMGGMNQSELRAFRVGVLQAVRDKAGTEAGQTSLLKMWKESATSDRLKQIFGNDYREFSAAVAAEARLKRLENVGRGSKTSAMQYAANDLDTPAIGDVASAANGAMSGRIGQAVTGAMNVWNRVKTPEEVRNEIGRILMMRGPQAQQELADMATVMQQVRDARMRNAARLGASGVIAPQLLPNQ